MTESNRIEEVDISKGIGMVLVITGHYAVVLYLVWYCL